MCTETESFSKKAVIAIPVISIGMADFFSNLITILMLISPFSNHKSTFKVVTSLIT